MYRCDKYIGCCIYENTQWITIGSILYSTPKVSWWNNQNNNPLIIIIYTFHKSNYILFWINFEIEMVRCIKHILFLVLQNLQHVIQITFRNTYTNVLIYIQREWCIILWSNRHWTVKTVSRKKCYCNTEWCNNIYFLYIIRQRILPKYYYYFNPEHVANDLEIYLENLTVVWLFKNKFHKNNIK